MKWSIGCVALLLTSIAFPVAASADTIFTDETFNLASYMLSPLYQSNATGQVTQCAACGDPGAALSIQIALGAGASEFAQAFINNGFTYNPMIEGPISFISASADKNEGINEQNVTITSNFRPVVYQNGNYYVANPPLIGTGLVTGPGGGGSTGYESISGSLTASDFILFNFSTGTFGIGNPNFSDPITLGLAQYTSLALPASSSFYSDYDNLMFDIVNPVPEPASITLVSTMLFGLAAPGLRRAICSEHSGR